MRNINVDNGALNAVLVVGDEEKNRESLLLRSMKLCDVCVRMETAPNRGCVLDINNLVIHQIVTKKIDGKCRWKQGHRHAFRASSQRIETARLPYFRGRGDTAGLANLRL